MQTLLAKVSNVKTTKELCILYKSIHRQQLIMLQNCIQVIKCIKVLHHSLDSYEI